MLRGDPTYRLSTAATKRFKTAALHLIPGSTAVYDDLLGKATE